MLCYLIGTGGIFAETRLANDWHTSIIGDLLQLLGKVAQCVFAHRTLWGETRYRPYTYLDASEKLFTAHVPHTLVRHGLLLALDTIKFYITQISTHLYTSSEAKYKLKLL